MFTYFFKFVVDFEIANYSDCFGPATGCPKHMKYYRMGDYKFELEGRKVIYAPIKPSKPSKPSFNPHTLPMHMLKGRRRYTPEVKRRMMKQMRTRTTKKMTKKATRKLTTVTELLEMYIIKNITVVKNGKKMFKVVKGYRKVTPEMDSDFLE